MHRASQVWQVIINPVTGRGKALRQWRQVERELRGGEAEWRVVLTEEPHHATRLVEEAVQAGIRRFVGVGGDGTHHELINGLLRSGLPAGELCYALLPAGTGNDWVRSWKIPGAPDRWAAMFRRGNRRFQDAGLLRCRREGKEIERYFANVAGMGYDAEVVRRLAEKGARNTSWPYFAAIFASLRHYQPQKLRLRYDGKVQEGLFYSLNAGIARYSGGGMSFVPHAVADDGRLALTLIGNIGAWGVIRNVYRLYDGSIGRHPEVQLLYCGRMEIETIGREPAWIECDGEMVGHTPLSLQLLPRALQFIVP